MLRTESVPVGRYGLQTMREIALEAKGHIKRLRIKFRANDVEFDMVETDYAV